MLSIRLDNVGKKFGREWIFRRISLGVDPGSRLAILGGNGSGKSTLLQVIAGYVTPNEGKVHHYRSEVPLAAESVYRHLSFASPYLQLPEDLTGAETVRHIASFKPFAETVPVNDVLSIAGLAHAAEKTVRQYSSGMKQRLKLALAILADTGVILLDEPASNLDREAVAWFRNLIADYGKQRTIIVCSNAIGDEYDFCDREISVTDYK